jgi:hypothetical protein
MAIYPSKNLTSCSDKRNQKIELGDRVLLVRTGTSFVVRRIFNNREGRITLEGLALPRSPEAIYCGAQARRCIKVPEEMKDSPSAILGFAKLLTNGKCTGDGKYYE